jgi:hypothetical protein
VNGKIVKTITLGAFALVAVLGAGLLSIAFLCSSAAAQDKPKEPIKEDHTINESTPRERQIELALSAAPAEVSSKATVYIFGPKGYEKAREGTNGVSCFLWRSSTVSASPACFDAEGSRTLMLAAMHGEELRAQGKSEAEIMMTTGRDMRMAASKCRGRVSFT